MVIYKPIREPSEETNSASTLISDFQPPELRKTLCAVYGTLLQQPLQTNTLFNPSPQ